MILPGKISSCPAHHVAHRHTQCATVRTCSFVYVCMYVWKNINMHMYVCMLMYACYLLPLSTSLLKKKIIWCLWIYENFHDNSIISVNRYLGLRRIPFTLKTDKEKQNREKYIRKHYSQYQCKECKAGSSRSRSGSRSGTNQSSSSGKIGYFLAFYLFIFFLHYLRYLIVFYSRLLLSLTLHYRS